MRFYQDGSSAVEVMKKIKELRKSHRKGITLDKRQSDYDRSRGRGAFLQEFESSSDEEPELDQTITHPAEEEEEGEKEGLTDNGPQDILPHLGGLWLGVCFWK